VNATNPSLILASRSVRRARLLHEGGYRFVQAVPPFDDPAQPIVNTVANPGLMLVGLAQKKARSLINGNTCRLDSESVILAADTVIRSPEGSLLGQPETRCEALKMLQTLIGTSHDVYSGAVMLDGDGRLLIEPIVDCACVQIGSVSHATLDAYLDSGLWQGKAGGYNLFELQSQWSITVTGDPTTVVGLPMKRLASHLVRWLDQSSLT